ncbi:MFS transporter [Streptomyces sioyaensis]|uniref:DHA2 family efflux MFS transporter permease subunit n=1 Tax=Streptomyces sioyaensis TaxID=67364 RepID=A0A4Q1QVE8_9ACTN|nr:MFS transporter [Streptomyces sioyaensis]MBM4795415.1 MFS transporter [Streptomyces sioyaensis]RXS66255.1 DHA2 family efflux MFS transporter permease subunit [Streptomyces sioyaensis]
MKKWRGNPWAMLVTLSLGYFMTMLDVTIINVAVPSISDDLHATLDDIAWVVNGYVLVLAVLLITAGRLGDVWGPRNLFLAGTALFTLSSVTCGFAATPGQLIASRFLQGLGAALLLPQTMTTIIATFPAGKRGTALGVWGSITGIATVVGPTAGGLLVTFAGWRWVFLINVPIGLAVLILGPLLLTDVRPGKKGRIDLLGVALSTAGLLLLTYGLTEGGRYHWGTVRGPVTIPGIVTGGAVLLLLFLLDQARKQQVRGKHGRYSKPGRDPLVPFVLFRHRDYTLMNAVIVLISVAVVGIYLPLNMHMQSALGYSALRAGLLMAPQAVVSAFVAPLAGRLADRIGGKYVLTSGLTLYTLGTATVPLVIAVNGPWYAYLPGFLIAGVGVGGTFGPLQTVATHSIPSSLAGAASGVINSNRQFGSVLGGLLVATVLPALNATLLISIGALVVAVLLCMCAGRPTFNRGGAPVAHADPLPQPLAAPRTYQS